MTVNGVGSPGTPGILVNGSLTGKSFDFESTDDFLLASTGNVVATNGNLKIKATNGAITINGNMTTGDATLQADDDVTVNQAISTGNLNISGQDTTIAAAVTAKDVNLTTTGDALITSSGLINSPGHHVSVNAGGNIDIAGAVTANDSDFHPTGNFTLESPRRVEPDGPSEH